MSFEKHLRAFRADVDLIGLKADSFHNNSTEPSSFDLDPSVPVDGLGIVDAAVGASFRQMRSDLDAVQQVGRDGQEDVT